MPSEPLPPPPPGQRQRITLGLIAGLLLVCAGLALFFLKRMPMPVRVFIAFGDLVLALAILLLMRKDPLRPR
ncbi:MAG: hypothetical protein ABSE59_00955 [Opitutaceae bacterium]|jgi:hypothetical protein